MDTSTLTTCDISGNPLLGSPSIAALTMCTQTGLYAASLLPYTISTKLPYLVSTAVPITSNYFTLVQHTTTNTHSTSLQNTRHIFTSAKSKMTIVTSAEYITSILLFI